MNPRHRRRHTLPVNRLVRVRNHRTVSGRGPAYSFGKLRMLTIRSQLYAINLFSDTKPYSASDLPDHDAFLSYRAYIVPFEKAGTTMYRLRLGFFEGYSVARAVQSELKAYFPSAWIAEVSLAEKNQSVKSSISEPVTAIEETIAEVGDITLNFEAADLREFVRVVFEDILKQNYLIDPQVKGKVTLHTTDPITEDALLPIVESVLQQNGAAVVFQQGIFKIVHAGRCANPGRLVGGEWTAGCPGAGLHGTDRSAALCRRPVRSRKSSHL